MSILNFISSLLEEIRQTIISPVNIPIAGLRSWSFSLLVVLILLCLSCKTKKDITETKGHFAPAHAFQLMPPIIVSDSVLFENSSRVFLSMDFPQAKIRYTLDGNPVTKNSMLYNNRITIDKTCVLQAVAFHSDCKTSETIKQQFYKVRNVFDNAVIRLHPQADARYAANGSASLADLQKGAAQFRGDQRWLGFKKDTINIDINLTQKTRMKSLSVSTLADEPGWIFLPQKIELLSADTVFSHVKRVDLKEASRTGLHYITVNFSERELKKITLRIIGEPLPKGHNGYGGVAWFFIDEIFVKE